MKPLLIIEDEHALAAALAAVARRLGREAVLCSSGQRGLDELGRGDFALAVLDIGLPDMSGFDVAELISSRTAVVLVSSRSPDQVSKRARGCGAVGFIAKDELTGAALEALVAAAP